MGFRVESLSGGLVNARDAAMLAPGELSYIQNAVYKPGSQALVKARGRANYATVSATASYDVVGLRDVKFDSGDHHLVALASNVLFRTGTTLSSTDTNTFASATSLVATANSLESVHYLDEWYLLAGVGAGSASGQNYVAYTSATALGQTPQFRPHGLLANTVTPTIATAAGVWTAGATGYFEYWFTEIYEYTKNGVITQLESTTSSPANSSAIPATTLYVTSTAMQALITLPGTPINSAATKWRLYRAGPKETLGEVLFPAGYKLADGEFAAATSVLDGGATTLSYTNADATAISGYATMTTPTNVFTSNNAYAIHSGTTPGAVAVTFPDITVVEPVVGICIGVEIAKSTNAAGYTATCQISNDSGVTWSVGKAIPLTTSDTLVELGAGNDDLWGLNWTSSSFTNDRFRVRVVCTSPSSTSISIDLIKARVTHAGTGVSLNEEILFPSVVINSPGGVTAAVGSHGAPPVSNTGDIFQGSLVTNNISSPAHIAYSLPDQPDYFPAIYFVDFETPDNDRVTNIKTLNNRLGVFLSSRLYRVNYLPTEVDADFNRGRCKEEVSAELGCINNMCACTFVGPSGRTEIAFVSNVGIHRTDLFTVQDLTTDIDWRDIFPVGSTAIALVNDPENGEILFYYSNSSGADSGSLTNETYQCLHLSYDGAHIKTGGKLKVSGPVFMRNYDSTASAYADLNSAWPVTIANGNTYIYLGYGGDSANSSAAGAGTVWRESSTDILPVNDPRMRFRTRRMFEAGWGKEWRLDASYLYLPDGYTSNDAQTLSITPITVRTNDSAATTEQTSVTATQDGHKLLKFQHLQEAEGMVLEVGQATGTTKNLGLQHIVLEGKNMGKEDSGI